MKILSCFCFLFIIQWAQAALQLPAVFGEHMVLQRQMAIPVWGKASPGSAVEVVFDGERRSVRASAQGEWIVALGAREAGGPYVMEVRSGAETVRFGDVMIGEVWVCSGQSNMGWTVWNSNYAQLEMATARNPQIRLLTVPRLGTQEPQWDFDGQWAVCSPTAVKDFSAVGYFFGRRIQAALGVPVGLINNAWGGSSAEAWVPRDVLAAHPQYAEMLADWDRRIAEFTDADLPERLAAFEKELAGWEASGREGQRPRKPQDIRINQHRPANIYNGMVQPLLGYGIRGTIWYQGESNANHAMQYRHLFPLLIETLRERWGQGNFPFYWVQLADFMEETATPVPSDWALLREAQTLTLDRVVNGGQAVIIDLGEGRDIHPRNKQDVANRLALWALAKDYGFDLPYQSPRYAGMEKLEQGRIRIDFAHVSAQGLYPQEGLYAFDTKAVKGFAIAGADGVFVWADAEIVGKHSVEVWSDAVAQPVAVRYGWANNPVLNLYDRTGLPVTPFRTDDWPE